MAKKLGEQLRVTKHEDWDDSKIGIFVYARTATLMRQIIASTFVKESRYNADTIRELLMEIGDLDSKPEQLELFSILEKLLSPIKDGDLPSAVKAMVESATKQLYSIQKFCWRGHTVLVTGLKEVIFSQKCSEKGWNPEVVMNALVVALVREIISLFGLSLDKLISLKVCSDAFDEVTTQALEEIDTLHTSFMREDARFREGKRTKYIQKYKVVLQAFDFKRYFPFQSPKQKQIYLDMLPVDEVPWEMWHIISKLVINLQQKLRSEQNSRDEELKKLITDKGKLRKEITENELEILKLRGENRNSQDAEFLMRERELQLDELSAKKEEPNYFTADHAALLRRITHLTSESYYWRKKYDDLKLDVFKELASAYTAKAKAINTTVLEPSGIGKQTRSKCEEVDLYLTVTVKLIENLGVSGPEEACDDDEDDEY